MADHPPRGVNACIDVLEKRRDWVVKRARSAQKAKQPMTYDVREGIALGYAIGLLKAAKGLGLVDTLEIRALDEKLIEPEWMDD